MKKVPKVAASTFDVKAWNDELLVLNPWARDLALSEQDATFIAARQAATLKRFEDRIVLTKWSEGMLALKDDVESAGRSSEMPLWIILSKADFTGHRFDRNLNFSGVLFVGPAVFKEAVFADVAFFESAIFSGEAVFEKTTFCRRVSFQYAQFSRYAHFEDTTFCVDPDFTRVSFAGTASFNGATFSCSNGPASFVSATFARVAYFRGSAFVGWAIFQDAVFSGEADFSGATFKSKAIFTRAKFESIVRFVRPASYGKKVEFIGPVDFSEASFTGAADFEDAVFCALAKFDALSGTATFSLANTQFKVVPSFFGAVFRALRLDNIQTPRNSLFGWTNDKDAPARFRELRRRAIEGKDPERELEFFAQEIRTSRFHSKWLPSFVPRAWEGRFYFGLAYGALSNFGRSIWRPVFCWLALLLLCATLYLGANEDMRVARASLNPSGTIGTLVAYAKTTRAALTNPPQCVDRALTGTTDPVIEAIQLSLRNAVIFESAQPEANRRTLACLYGPEDAAQEKYSIMSPRMSFISTLQSLASGVLIFLLLLATRNLLRLR